MARLVIFLLAAVAAFAADDSWNKVKDLKSGVEIRVIKKGSVTPVQGNFYEANDENLILVVKKEEIAIPKDQIDRLDSRPPASRVTKETTTKEDTSNQSKEPRAGMNGPAVAAPGTSTSTSVGFGSRPDFETIYRRPPAAPKK
jgi:hypothetical protein